MLFKLEGFPSAMSHDLMWDIIISNLLNAQVTHVQLFYYWNIPIQTSTNGSE